MTARKGGFRFNTDSILGIVVLVVGFVALWFIARGIFTLLSWLAPVLLVGAIIINYKTIINFGKFIIQLFKRNPIMGVIAVILMVIGFPITAGFLFGKALLDRRIAKVIKAQDPNSNEEYAEYEEVVEIAEAKEEDVLELKEMEEEEEPNKYDDLFDEKS